MPTKPFLSQFDGGFTPGKKLNDPIAVDESFGTVYNSGQQNKQISTVAGKVTFIETSQQVDVGKLLCNVLYPAMALAGFRGTPKGILRGRKKGPKKPAGKAAKTKKKSAAKKKKSAKKVLAPKKKTVSVKKAPKKAVKKATSNKKVAPKKKKLVKKAAKKSGSRKKKVAHRNR